MPSLEDQAATDFDRLTEVQETVIRRIGGRDDRTENVTAVVELDSSLGMVDGNNGQYFDFAGTMEIPAAQDNTMEDTWVIRGEVYKQQGEAIGKDAASQTIQLLRRKGRRAREPRTTGR